MLANATPYIIVLFVSLQLSIAAIRITIINKISCQNKWQYTKAPQYLAQYVELLPLNNLTVCLKREIPKNTFVTESFD